MPPKLCGRCNKTVYPTEELKCLDKVWHKGCFKCQTCNMTLNMKNYKGYDKLPYCNAHYPQTKHTAVADTPETRRIAENTKIQSNIKYHAEYEKQKGKKITVADDPETQRVRHNMEVISNISYHGDRERRSQMEMARPAEQVEGEQVFQPERDDGSAGRVRAGQPGRIADYDPATEQKFVGGSSGTPYSNRNSSGARQVYDSNVGRDRVQRFSSSGDDDQAQLEQPQTRKVGSISDYDPVNEKYGSITGQYSGDRRSQPVQQPAYQPPQQPYQPPQPQYQPPQQPYQPPQQQYQPPPPAEPPVESSAGKGMVCKAMYDYDAADNDEVGFKEGDLLVFCQPIDAGWMEGTVESTGQRGMLPSNYVEQLN